MKFIALRDLKIRPSQILDELAEEDMVVTRNGKPAAALVFLDEDLLDEFIIAHHPKLLEEAEESRREYSRSGGIDHDAMKALVEKGRKRTHKGKKRRG